MTTLNLLDANVIKRTVSRCPACLEEVPASVVRRDGEVRMVKTCPTHGRFDVRVASYERFYHDSRGASRDPCCGSSCGCGTATGIASEASPVDPFETLSTCIALIEIVRSCNLSCPTCFAASPVGAGEHVDAVPFEEFTQRVGGVIRRKGFIDILQLSGGEPTIHPEFLRLLRWAIDQKDIGYVLVNTNAVRLAVDGAFREEVGALRRAKGKFELYVQFDGTQESGQRELRGADLRDIRRRAIDESGRLGVPSTLAMTVTPRTMVNLGETLRFGLERRHCRGITFQPMFTSGRAPSPVSTSLLPILHGAPEPITVGDVVLNLVEQSDGLLTEADFTPLPCGDPNCHTIGYLLRTAEGPRGLSRFLDLAALQGFLGNRVDYRLEDLARCGCETEPLGELIKQFEIGPDAPFRMFIKPFMDAWTFDQDRIDRCCTHVIRRDGSLDSFCRYYLNGGEHAWPIAAAAGSVAG